MNREQQIETEIQNLVAEREAIRSRRTWKCPHCEKRTQLAKLTIIQDHYYVRPYSCSGGDYWTSSKEVFIPCPKCETVVRICDTFVQVPYVMTTDDKEMYDYVTDHRTYFNERLDYYGESTPTYDQIDSIREDNNKRRH